MQISLLNWPPRRLVRESILNHNLRHPEAPLDLEKAPWQDIVSVIFAFVRHELTNYDAELRAQTKGAYDEEKRNALAERITARTRAAFPWLKQDPRPFPKKERELELDESARRLADLRTYEYHVSQVLSETRDRLRKKELREHLVSVREKIAEWTGSFDNSPPPSEHHVRVYSRPTKTGKDYDFFGYHFHLNYLRFCGFTCPLCRVSVIAVKRALPFGQGQKRFFASCHCVCIATDKTLRRLDFAWWTDALNEHGILGSAARKLS
jgi:hypothetical protein